MKLKDAFEFTERLKHKTEQRKALLCKLVAEYRKPIGKEKLPEEEVDKYYAKVKKLSLKELYKLDGMKGYKLRLDVMDRIKSIRKKKYAVITIFNDNKTTDTGVCQVYNRSFTRGGMRYIIMPERSIYDPEFRMSHFYYYANQIFPINFQKPPNPDNTPDARLLNDCVENGVIEALANLDMSSLIKICLVSSVMTFIVAAFLLILQLRGGL